jgi:hypothetical protein
MAQKLVTDPWGNPAVEREGLSALRIMGPMGDTKVLYEPASQEQVDAVCAKILELHAQGFSAFAFTAGDKVGELVRPSKSNGEWKASVAEYERVVMAPQMAGGAR